MTTTQSSRSGPVRKAILAWIGAVVLVQENLEGCVAELVSRGERVEAEGRDFVQSLLTKRTATEVKSASPKPARLIDRVLVKLGRPTRDDTEQLKQKMAQLEERIEAFLKAHEPASVA